MNVKIELAETDVAIQACFPVMKQLRKHLDADSFNSCIRSQRQYGYRLVRLMDPEESVAVGGFRISKNLAWGRHLFVDDLVTLRTSRSKGFGGLLLEWLVQYAQSHDCAQIHLDSGIQRTEAHRFYQREGFDNTSLHFQKVVKAGVRN